jgi:molybdate transport system regulatory protein
MAGPKGSKYFDVFLNYGITLNSKSQEGCISEATIELLKEIETYGSLKRAAQKQGLSYRKAWGDIKNAEKFLGFAIVEAVRGGKDGGLSRLTPDGQELVQAFRELHTEFNQAIYRITKKFFHKLNQQEELFHKLNQPEEPTPE